MLGQRIFVIVKAVAGIALAIFFIAMLVIGIPILLTGGG
jgi:hypothetical protein